MCHLLGTMAHLIAYRPQLEPVGEHSERRRVPLMPMIA
jgi:hypothetical protein